MAKPILHSADIFDATQDKYFTFSWRGNAIKTCTLNIYNSSTDIQVFSEAKGITDKNYTYLLPAESLTNGMSYYATLIIVDTNDTVSTISNTITFKCYEKPKFEIDVPNDTTLVTTTIEVNALLESDVDSIKTIKFYLYDNKDDSLLIESDEFFYETEEDLHFRFIGMENNHSYKVSATCTTINGFKLETEPSIVNIECIQVNYGGKCYVQSNRLKGYVRFSTNFVIIQAGDDFIFNDGLIDLSNDKLQYVEGFNMSEDLYMCIRGKGFNGTVFQALNETGDVIEISVHWFEDLNAYKAMLKIIQGKCTYIIFSDEFNVTGDYLYDIRAYRVNNLYEIQVIKFEENTETTNIETTEIEEVSE